MTAGFDVFLARTALQDLECYGPLLFLGGLLTLIIVWSRNRMDGE